MSKDGMNCSRGRQSGENLSMVALVGFPDSGEG
mgnify:CR=1 FL=1